MHETPTGRSPASHCIRVMKVYDWVTKQVHIPLYLEAENVLCAWSDNISNFSQLDQDVQLRCFLSDEHGNGLASVGVNSIFCEEIPQRGGRKNVTVTLQNGSRVILQKVKIANWGFIVLKAIDNQGNACQSLPISFRFDEALLLCAPQGTFVDCHLSYFDCNASFQCNNNNKLQNISIAIDLCQEVQMEAIAKILLRGEVKIIKKQLIEEEIIKKEFEKRFPPGEEEEE